jgi:hypothetical protein
MNVHDCILFVLAKNALSKFLHHTNVYKLSTLYFLIHTLLIKYLKKSQKTSCETRSQKFVFN